MKLIFIIFLVCSILCSCTKSQSTENLRDYSSMFYGKNSNFMYAFDAQAVENGVFLGGYKIEIYDFETNCINVLCTQAGCSHNDNSCPAYIGYNSLYTIYNDYFYALNTDTDGKISLKKRHVSDNAWETIWFKLPSNKFSTITAEACIGDNIIAVYLSEHSYDPETMVQKDYHQLVSIDISTYKVEELTDKIEDPTEYLSLRCADKNQCILTGYSIPAEAESQGNFIAREIMRGKSEAESVEAYWDYLKEIQTLEIVTYNLLTGNKNVIASGKHDKLLRLTDRSIVYNGNLYFYQDQDVIAYNLITEEYTKILDFPNIVNIYCFDNKLFFIVRESADKNDYLYYYYDLEGNKEIVNMKNNDNTKYAMFSISSENDDCFVGLYENNLCWITKKDFYAEKYKNAHKIR